MGKNNRKDAFIGPLKGWAKFFHRLFLFITYPVRKPKIWLLIVPVLAILYLAPTFRGIKPAEVHLWYWGMIQQNISKISAAFNEQTQKILPQIQPAPKAPQMIDLPVKESRRKVFERAKSAPVVVVEAAPAEVNLAPRPAPRRQVSEEVEQPKLQPAAQKTNKLDLNYLDEPKTVSGVARFLNANELQIDNTYMFLYGIYVDPKSDKGFYALNFLDKLVKGKTVVCTINAYTHQSIATAVCTVNGENINRLLVDRGYSRNVALD